MEIAQHIKSEAILDYSPENAPTDPDSAVQTSLVLHKIEDVLKAEESSLQDAVSDGQKRLIELQKVKGKVQKEIVRCMEFTHPVGYKLFRELPARKAQALDAEEAIILLQNFPEHHAYMLKLPAGANKDMLTSRTIAMFDAAGKIPDWMFHFDKYHEAFWSNMIKNIDWVNAALTRYKFLNVRDLADWWNYKRDLITLCEKLDGLYKMFHEGIQRHLNGESTECVSANIDEIISNAVSGILKARDY